MTYGPKRFIDEFLEMAFPPELIKAGMDLMQAQQNYAELVCPITPEQKERAAKLARERGWKGPMPWEPGYQRSAAHVPQKGQDDAEG